MKSLFPYKKTHADKRLLSYPERLNRLRSVTVISFLLLFIPISIIFYIGFTQFEKDVLIQYQGQTDKVTQQINKRLFKRAALANALSTSEFDYYKHLYNPVTQKLSKVLSVLANPEYYEYMQGHVGYFQIDQEGKFNSPSWPVKMTFKKINKNLKNAQEGSSSAEKRLSPELLARKNLALELYNITAQSTELQHLINQGLLEQHNKFHLITDLPDYYILYRVVNLNDQTKLQGYLLNRDAYLNSIIETVLNRVQFDNPIALSLQSQGRSSYKNNFLYELNEQRQVDISQPKPLDQKFNQQFISSQVLNWPFSSYSITYSTDSLQLTSAAIYSGSLMVILLIAIVLGCLGFYRVGVKQLKLAEQRLNFVSSVSHELKTPLTSIRMYAEMLKTGIVLSSEHKREYYEFIHSESERLSRLIDNILQLSSLSQPQHSVKPQYIKMNILMDIIRSKVSSLIDKNDFQLNISHAFEYPEKVMLLVDIDAFTQVVINITDNAIKFFDRDKINESSRQTIDFIFSLSPKNKESIELTIRDYGCGISVEQESKIFDLFYRGGSELTRSTQGTGIGLALVNQLMLAQLGSIQVHRMNPGLAMQMSFKGKFPSQNS